MSFHHKDGPVCSSTDISVESLGLAKIIQSSTSNWRNKIKVLAPEGPASLVNLPITTCWGTAGCTHPAVLNRCQLTSSLLFYLNLPRIAWFWCSSIDNPQQKSLMNIYFRNNSANPKVPLIQHPGFVHGQKWIFSHNYSVCVKWPQLYHYISLYFILAIM